MLSSLFKDTFKFIKLIVDRWCNNETYNIILFPKLNLIYLSQQKAECIKERR